MGLWQIRFDCIGLKNRGSWFDSNWSHQNIEGCNADRYLREIETLDEQVRLLLVLIKFLALRVNRYFSNHKTKFDSWSLDVLNLVYW